MTFVHDLTQRLEENREKISDWMSKKRSEVPIPIYGSVGVACGWRQGDAQVASRRRAGGGRVDKMLT